eukprot:scaffold7821_cov27-Phaeocystis_antarctica.AAC.1
MSHDSSTDAPASWLKREGWLPGGWQGPALHFEVRSEVSHRVKSFNSKPVVRPRSLRNGATPGDAKTPSASSAHSKRAQLRDGRSR